MNSPFSTRLAVLLITLAPCLLAEETDSVYMANGIKIGEVSTSSAIIWSRLTMHPERIVEGKPFPENVNKTRKSLHFDDLGEMEGGVPGTAGEMRITYWPVNSGSQRKSTEWMAVDATRDFTLQVRIGDLMPGERYAIVAEGRPPGGTDPSCRIEGLFGTAPEAGASARVGFAVVTGQEYSRRDDKRGHKIYTILQKKQLDFFVHTGDIVYYDKPGPYADSVELARFKWNRIYSLPNQRAFHNTCASYFMKDDHDTLKNDCWPGQAYGNLTWKQGLSLFREQVPMGEHTFRTVRWGKHLQIWFVEGRDFRSPNDMPDGPKKTIWGIRQKQWFFDTVCASDATFRILISPTPIVGPDRSNKNDNHANKGFTVEGDELRSFIGRQKNMFVICGDRHWQYVSEDPKTGAREYSCGPTSDAHAGGFKEENKSHLHRYLKVTGGFLSVQVECDDDSPVVVFRHHGVDGSVLNEDVIRAVLD